MKIKAYYGGAVSNGDSYKIFEIRPQSTQRDWMNVNVNIGFKKYHPSFGPTYKCLPLKIGNELGWSIHCMVDFSCIWNGKIEDRDGVLVKIDDKYKKVAATHFGNGIITLPIPYIFKTEKNYGIYVRGPTNFYKEYVQYLDAVIETDWLNYPFTYNIKINKANHEIFFKKGEPICSFIPIKLKNINSSILEIENIESNKQLNNFVKKYSENRSYKYNELTKINYEKEQKNESLKYTWMKDYFLGGGLKVDHPAIGCPYFHFKKISLEVYENLSIFNKIKLFLKNIKNKLDILMLNFKYTIDRHIYNKKFRGPK